MLELHLFGLLNFRRFFPLCTDILLSLHVSLDLYDLLDTGGGLSFLRRLPLVKEFRVSIPSED